MKVLSKADILSADDLVKEVVDVNEWGGSVYVRCMTGQERDRYELTLMDLSDKDKAATVQNIRATLLALTICDEQGKLLFSEGEIAELGKKSSKALDRVREVAEKLNFNQDEKKVLIPA